MLKKCEGDGDGGSRNPRGENIDRYTEDKTGKRERRRDGVKVVKVVKGKGRVGMRERLRWDAEMG